MVVSSRKYENYSYSKVLKTFLVDQIKSNQLDGKFGDYVVNGNPRQMKVYELLGIEPGGSKFINCRWITFSESHQGKKSKNLEMKLLETMVEKT